MCPQIGYYVMSEKTSLSSADQQHQWIKDKLRTIGEAINQLKRNNSPQIGHPSSPAKQEKVVFKDLVILK